MRLRCTPDQLSPDLADSLDDTEPATHQVNATNLQPRQLAPAQTTTRYDKEGRATETRQPLSIGTDAGTTKTIAYTAGANADDAACGNKVEWAGLTCRTYPGAPPTAGAAGAATLPDSRTTAYTAWLQPLTVVETSGAVTRTTQTVYDTAGRPTTARTTVTGLTESTSRPGTYTHYIPAGQTAAGSVDYSGTLNAAQTDADPTARTATTYDAWGRPLTSTNDLGDITTTTYIAPGQPGAGSVATITENPAAAAQPDQTTAYTYDGTDAEEKTERRGLLTAQTITRAGSAGGSGTLNFAAAYDADGNLVTQKLPGQVTQTTSYDAAGEPTGLTYSGTVQPVKLRLDANGVPVTDTNGDPVYDPDGPPQTNQPWLAWTVHNDTQGRVRTETTGPAAGFDGNPGVSTPADITGYDVGQAIAYDRAYTYDAAGRLATVTDHTADAHGADLDASPCAVRSYGFDANGRRTSLAAATHADGNCAGTTAVTTTTSSFDNYDTADRPTLGIGGVGQYAYDAMGRQTTLPGVDAPNPAGGDIALGYFDDDLPSTITQGRTSTTFALDSNGRRLQASTTTGTQTTTLVRHYTGGDDNPAWTVATDPLAASTTTRYAESIGGDLGLSLASDGAANLTLATLHGDIVTTVPIAAAAATGDPAAGIDGWSDYTEYGTPRDTGATAAVSGEAGYGWLGAKQRSTTAETAGLTLMGDRLYNPATGRFTSPDPEPGGNPTAYTYPNDPINMYDLDGHWGWLKKAGRLAWKYKWEIAATAAMFVPGLGAAALAWRAYKLARGGIYVARTVRGGTYVGQSGRVGARLSQHVRAGKITPWRAMTARVYRVKGNKTRREVAEQRMINRLGGKGRLENVRNPIGPKRQHLMRSTPRNWRGL